MAEFRPYNGWEADLREVVMIADAALHGATVTPLPMSGRPVTERIRTALEPEKCGKVLYRRDGNAVAGYEWTPDHSLGLRHLTDGVAMTCGLPAGHHPYVSRGHGTCAHLCEIKGSRWEECGKPADDPCHSPGHVPDVPNEAWR